MLLLTNDDVRKLLDMRTCFEALEQGYQDLAAGNAVYRPRIDVWAPSDPPDSFFRWRSMEGICRSYGVFAIRIKSYVAHWTEGQNEPKYRVRPGRYAELIALFSLATGEPLAIIHDRYLLSIRAAGTAGLGVKYLARPDARVVGIIGSGRMARTYLQAFIEVRSLARVKVYSRSRERREAYAAEMHARLGIPIEVYDSAEPVVRGSDIVATCTNSTVPVLTEPSWIEEGMHLTNLNPNELSAPHILARCDVVIRLGDQTLPRRESHTTFRPFHVAGYAVGQPEELAQFPQPSLPVDVEQYAHLVDLVSGKVSGRVSSRQVTCLLNGGAQGLHCASVGGRLYHLAREKGIGQEVPTDWFVDGSRE